MPDWRMASCVCAWNRKRELFCKSGFRRELFVVHGVKNSPLDTLSAQRKPPWDTTPPLCTIPQTQEAPPERGFLLHPYPVA